MIHKNSNVRKLFLTFEMLFEMSVFNPFRSIVWVTCRYCLRNFHLSFLPQTLSKLPEIVTSVVLTPLLEHSSGYTTPVFGKMFGWVVILSGCPSYLQILGSLNSDVS